MTLCVIKEPTFLLIQILQLLNLYAICSHLLNLNIPRSSKQKMYMYVLMANPSSNYGWLEVGLYQWFKVNLFSQLEISGPGYCSCCIVVILILSTNDQRWYWCFLWYHDIIIAKPWLGLDWSVSGRLGCVDHGNPMDQNKIRYILFTTLGHQ